MKNLLTVKDLAISYEGKRIIENVSFEVEEGDFLVIFGENGSGKSSLVKVLLNLKAPLEGEVSFMEGFNRNEIGYLPQLLPMQKDFPASAWEVVISGCLNKMGRRPFYGKKEKEVLTSPNSTLAVEYIRALNKISPDVRLLPVKRKGSGHDSEEIIGDTASASKIRAFESLSEVADYMPEKAYTLIGEAFGEGNGPYIMKTGERAVLSTLREMKKEEYSCYVTDSSGLANRIYEAVQTADSLDSLYEKAKSKNYTHSRIRREVMNLFLKIPKGMSKEKVPYMRILAVSEKGISLLGKAKENSAVPIITRHSEMAGLTERGKEVYALQCASTDKFSLFTEKIRECSLEQKNSMKIFNADSI